MSISQPNPVTLRDVTDADLDHFFDHMRDPAAVHQAAFTAKDPTDRAAFNAHWSKIRTDPTVTLRTILFNNTLAGHIASFGPPGDQEITYWIARPLWNQGIATAALTQFLRDYPTRPLRARAAQDNLPSLRVLAKCGFRPEAHDRFFANVRNATIDEVILCLA